MSALRLAARIELRQALVILDRRQAIDLPALPSTRGVN